MPGRAKDIAVGGGAVWVIGTNSEGGGYGIYRWNSSKNNWDKIPGSAVRIAVDHSNGYAWVVNNKDVIYKYTGSGWK